MQTEESRKIVLEYLAARESGDDSRMMELLDEKVRWTPPSAGGLGVPEGRENVIRTFAEAGARYFDMTTMKASVKWIVAEGDRVVIRMSGPAKAVNGRDYSNEYVWVYTCANGRIVDIEEHTDTQRFKEIVLD